MRRVAVTVNGVRREADVEPRQLFVYFLREQLGLTGTNVGCDTTTCGACTVLLDGKSVKPCALLAVQADGREVTTIEGLARDGELHPLQRAFHENHALQCGFCTPGQIASAAALVDAAPHASRDEIRHAMAGNLCRCGTYPRIEEAIASVVESERAPSAGGDENTWRG